MTAQTLDDLLAIEAIKRLKYKYLRCLDQKRWDEIASCFTKEATAQYSGGGYSFDSRDGIIEFLSSAMGSTSMLTSHHCGQPEIDVLGPDSATGVWALKDMVIHQDFGLTIHGAAFYEDQYVKVDDTWLIKHTGYKRVYEEIIPRASIEGLKVTAEWWATDGRSSLA